MAKNSSNPAQPNRGDGTSSPTAEGTTSSGPSYSGHPENAMAKHAVDQQSLAAAMPMNETKSAEYGYGNAVNPQRGSTQRLPSASAGAGTLKRLISNATFLKLPHAFGKEAPSSSR